MKTEEKYSRRQNGLELWLISEFNLMESQDSKCGYDIIYGEESNNDIPDISAMIDGKQTAFLFADTIDKNKLKKRIKFISKKYEKICIVIFDSHLRAELVKVIPKSCGILCISNSFGLGMMYQLMRDF